MFPPKSPKTPDPNMVIQDILKRPPRYDFFNYPKIPKSPTQIRVFNNPPQTCQFSSINKANMQCLIYANYKRFINQKPIFSPGNFS